MAFRVRKVFGTFEKQALGEEVNFIQIFKRRMRCHSLKVIDSASDVSVFITLTLVYQIYFSFIHEVMAHSNVSKLLD